MMNHGTTQRVMDVKEIPAFVKEVVSAGYDICAVGDRNYVFNEPNNLQPEDCPLNRIIRKFGDRDFITLEIVAYLRSIGRYIDPMIPN